MNKASLPNPAHVLPAALLPSVEVPRSGVPLSGLRVMVLGRGRVGRALATGLAAHGAVVAALSGSVIPAAGDITASDVLILSVPDDVIAEVAERLTPHMRAGQIIAHTSGRHGLAVLDAPRLVGAHGLAFHPAMTFTGSDGDVERIAGARVGLTADPGAVAMADRLCAALGATPTWVTEDNRALYHAGLTHAANHLVTLIAEAQSLLVRAGVDDPSAVLEPLVTAALAGVLERGAFATTGPVVRGDAGTVGEHLRVLAEVAPEVLDSYTALAQGTARLAIVDGRLGEAAGARITDVLDGVSA